MQDLTDGERCTTDFLLAADRARLRRGDFRLGPPTSDILSMRISTSQKPTAFFPRPDKANALLVCRFSSIPLLAAQIRRPSSVTTLCQARASNDLKVPHRTDQAVCSPLVQVTHRELPNSRIELTLTISPEATQKNYNAFVRKVESETHLPGFRRGQKVPLPLLMRSRGGEEAFKGEALQQLVETAAEKALRDWQGRAIEDSDRLETSPTELAESFSPDEALQFRISFDVMSEVKWASPYRDLKVIPRSRFLARRVL